MVLQPALEVDAVGPEIDVVPGAQVAGLPFLMVALPFGLEPRERLMGQGGRILAQERAQGFGEIAAGDAAQVEDRQDRVEGPGSAREPGQQRGRETDAFLSGAGPVTDLGAPHRHRADPGKDLAFRPPAMADQALAPVLGFQVTVIGQEGIDLGFNGMRKKLAGA